MSNIKIRNLESSAHSSVTSGNFVPMALNPDEGHERVTEKVTLSQIVSGGAVYADFSDQLKVSGQAVLTGFEIPGGGSVIEGSDDSISFGPSEPGDDRDLSLYQGGEEKISMSDDVIQIGGGDTVTDTVEIVNNTLVKENFTVEPGKTTTLGGPTNINDELTVESGKTTTLGGPTNINDELTVASGKTTTLGGPTLFNDTANFVGAATFSNAATFNQPATFTNISTLNGPTVFGDTANFIDTSKITFGADPNTQTLQDIVNDLVSQAGSGGVDTLSALTDTTISSAADGDVLVWDGTASAWINAQPSEDSFFSSDLLLKDNVTTIKSAIQKLSSIRGVQFEWNEKAQKSLIGKHDVGIIAQDVEKVIPSAVRKNKEYLEVEYHKIIPLLIQSVLELSDENSDLKKRLKKLES